MTYRVLKKDKNIVKLNYKDCRQVKTKSKLILSIVAVTDKGFPWPFENV